MTNGDTTVFLTGHAKPVKDDAINAVYQVFSLSLIVDTRDDMIVDVGCTMVMDKSESFIRALLTGRNLLTDMDSMQEQIKTRFFTLAQKPVLVALKDAQNRYLIAFPHKKNIPQEKAAE